MLLAKSAQTRKPTTTSELSTMPLPRIILIRLFFRTQINADFMRIAILLFGV
jgi:hypothetical protein